MNRLLRTRLVLMLVAFAIALGVPGLGKPAPVAARTTVGARTPTGWKYTALGDSLATGVLSLKGYVPRYKDYTQADTGTSISLNNLGQNGWTS